MQRIFEHINGFTDLMNRKGYDGYFQSSLGFSDRLRDNLTKHVFQCYEEKREAGPLNLTTHAYWKDNKSNYVQCNFQVDFSEPTGFNVQKINIEYGNEYGRLRNKEISVRNSAEIPDRETVNRMMLEKKRGMKI